MTTYIHVYTCLFIAIMLSSCQPKKSSSSALKAGMWQGIITLPGQKEVPFTFKTVVQKDSLSVILYNGSQELLLDEVTVVDDSVKIVLHVFDAEIRAQLKDGNLSGVFIKNYNRKLDAPFRATYGKDYRFVPYEETKKIDFSGKYQITFYAEEGREIPSVGWFTQTGNRVTGSFLGRTGDYGFLDGNVVEGKLLLSNFDGNHVLLVEAVKSQNTLTGILYSGSSQRAFKGLKNMAATISYEEKTFLKEGYDKIDFTFPDMDGQQVSLSDTPYQNKVVVLQIMGTWCPNCLDETKFLSPWYDKNKQRGVEVIALAYERKEDFQYASDRVRKLKDKFNISYPVLIAGTINTVSESLPMVDNISGFPTTIYIDKSGQVRYIHTGIDGPATGEFYTYFIEDFTSKVTDLLEEK